MPESQSAVRRRIRSRSILPVLLAVAMPALVAHAEPLSDDAEAGREVFRFETFGNEGFWTDAMRLPQGIMAAKLTPLQALEAGLHVDVEAVPPELAKMLAEEFGTDLSAAAAPLLNDPATTLKLVKANAVIGVVPKGEKVGITCTICHAVTDGSAFEMDGKGSVGKRVDGRGTYSIQMGQLLALAANSRAYYPNLQLELGGETIGRSPVGIRRDSTEAEVDAYLRNSDYYPRGTFDETQDGIGNPVQNTPLFRQDLTAPYGSNGLYESLAGISNGSYTTNLDPTALATPAGRELLVASLGDKGAELHANYVAILEETGVSGHPFVEASGGHPIGHRATPVGRQVDARKLANVVAYMKELPPPKAPAVDVGAATRGQGTFEASCTGCHEADPEQAVPLRLVSLDELWPAYAPVTLAEREAPRGPIEDSPGGYDDKMVVLDASERGAIRGVSFPLLIDLARKPRLLHDDSVAGLDALLDPARGADEPHPFYVDDEAKRTDVVIYLEGRGIPE